jgi:hypothetical protein
MPSLKRFRVSYLRTNAMNATSTAIAAVESERSRALRELFKAEVATVQALVQIKATSRELRERIDEASPLVDAAEGHRSLVVALQAMPRLPRADAHWG